MKMLKSLAELQVLLMSLAGVSFHGEHFQPLRKVRPLLWRCPTRPEQNGSEVWLREVGSKMVAVMVGPEQ